MRALLFSTLYPGATRPRHGLFVEKRALELVRQVGVHVKVVAPVPWFPLRGDAFGDYAALARMPVRETRQGIDVLHPRYLLLPKVGMTLAPLAMALGALGCVRRLLREGFEFDVIDAHYAYPDGVAAALVGVWLGKPVVITARGSDLNLIARYALPRAMIRWAARSAFACIGVSGALVEQWRALGARETHLMRNGVDGQMFSPAPQTEARARLGLGGGALLVTVGNLVELKRHHCIVAALAALSSEQPDLELAIVGAGPLGPALQAAAERAGVAHRVRLVGPVPQEDLRWWYSAADVSVLASEREGWPNVLLESMACGTPVVASRVGGVPEIIDHESLGLMFDPGSQDALVDALRQALLRRWDRGAIRCHAATMTWDETSRRQAWLFERASATPGAARHA